MNELIRKITKTQMRSTLAVIITSGVFILIAGLQLHSIPPTNSEIVYMAIGMLNTCFVTVVAYYFGSTKNETDKQQNEENT